MDTVNLVSHVMIYFYIFTIIITLNDTFDVNYIKFRNIIFHIKGYLAYISALYAGMNQNNFTCTILMKKQRSSKKRFQNGRCDLRIIINMLHYTCSTYDLVTKNVRQEICAFVTYFK